MTVKKGIVVKERTQMINTTFKYSEQKYLKGFLQA